MILLYMSANTQQIQKDKLYVELFKIFEKELLNIFETVSPFQHNLWVFGNKIHELHLRICAEVENLVKEVAQDFFWENEIKKLEKTNTDNDIKNKLERLWYKSYDEKLLSYISEEKYEPFSFYFSLLNDKLWLSCKRLIFIWWVEWYNFWDVGSYFVPFQIKKWNKTPVWRSNYNGIKHNKLKKYQICNLWDLINAFWAYYILLNYLVVWLKRPLQTSWIIMQNPLQNTKKRDSLKSSIFMVTSTYIHYPYEFYSKSTNLEIIETWKSCIKEMDKFLTDCHNGCFEKYVNVRINPSRCLYYTSFFILPCVKTNGLKVYKILPFIKFVNKRKEKIKSVILGNKDKNWSREYVVDTWWPNDFMGIYQWINDENV